ncbi:MAG TPA: CDP-alcohol phosphatidyltransferase family protein [Candidatus Binatia bacterium]|nr:CDP-alcohol phosphatidyltransferase family protein [Candidatus Binatia bacterium]
MLDSAFGRPGAAIDRALNRLADFCVRRGVSANRLTYAALILGVVSGVMFGVGRQWLATLAVVGSGTADAIDGRVARRGDGGTRWGGVIDLTFDRIVEAAVLLGIALPQPAWHAPALVLAATWYVNLCVFLAVGAASDRASEKVIDYPPGLLERSELLLLLFVVLVLPAWVPIAAYVYAGLEIVTATQRLLHGRRALAGLR